MNRRLCIMIFIIFISRIFSQSYDVCDNDYDGKYIFTQEDKANILNLIVEENYGNNEVYVTRSKGGIIKISDLRNNPKISTVCSSIKDFDYYFEIAINSNKELFISDDKRKVYKVNPSDCTSKEISQYVFLSDPQAMSFDNKNNLYVGGGGSGTVLRAEANDLSKFKVWKIFDSGFPSGDFVTIRDKMYISWAYSFFDSENHLYEITLDSNNNYISHKDLGRIRDYTYGLAVEYGVLYGITAKELYKINLDNLSTETVIKNPSTDKADEWWGAAGLHEAYDLQYRIYDNINDANSENNELSFPYENSIPFQKKIYIRVDNLYNHTFVIYPINLVINIPPANNLKNEYVVCNNGTLKEIEINTFLSEKDYSFSWYFNGSIIENETNSKIITTKKGIYKVKIINKKTGCSGEFSTKVIQSDIFISDISFSVKSLSINAFGTDYPFLYAIDEKWQQSPTFYEFTLGEITGQAKNDRGCLSTKLIKTLNPFNIITPNNDGVNDKFYFGYPSITNEYEIKIVDKYGRILINKKIDDDFAWDGKDLNGAPLPSGTYWYMVILKGEKKYSGFILLKNN